MRCTSAVVLSTLAISQAAAASLHNRHASFHARREAAAKRDPTEAIDWDALAYDLKDVKWDEVNWKSVFASSSAAAPTPTPEQKQPAPSSTVPEVVSSPPAKSSAAPVATKAAEVKVDTKNIVDNLVSDVLQGVSTIANKLGAKVGTNSKTNNGGIWIGSDSAWGMEVTNSGSKDAVFYCWKANGFSGMSINVNIPDISVGIKAGQKVDLSFAADVPAACAPATDSTKLALFGGLHETWAEVTFGQYGAFDVSRNVNMRGISISMKGSKCTSDMETCVFKCKDSSRESCEAGTDYDLYNCSAGNGGGGGYDPIMAGTGGGCSMGSSGEKIKVSFS